MTESPKPAFNYTLGSRWNSVGKGVGVVIGPLSKNFCCIKFNDGMRAYKQGNPACPDASPEYHITGPADGQPDDDGWIIWRGGECPVPKWTIGDVKLRDGEITAGCILHELRWQHYNSYGDIIAYRIVKPAPEETAPRADAVNDGGPAFPGAFHGLYYTGKCSDGSAAAIRDTGFNPGMSVRMYAAIHAMQGMLASGDELKRDDLVEGAMSYADALIAEAGGRDAG